MGVSSSRLRSPWFVRAVVFAAILTLLAPAAVSAITYEPTALQAGTVTKPANGTTVISVQGFKVAGQDSGKKPARLVGVGPRGSMQWEYNGSQHGVKWFYDVDPLDDGTLLITGTKPGQTIVTKWNPETNTTVWTRTLALEDTHDIDLINDDQLLIANMRNYNESTDTNNDRLLIYDLSTNETVWQWRFRSAYPPAGGGDYTDDWTHVNDVDKIGEGQYLASPRNFDQVIVVDRSTKNITLRVGEDENHDVMYEQHNPQYLTGQNQTPTVLIADSENDRVVEYARTDGEWARTWELTGNFSWPRDADRLPNGNTLITDTLNHRVVEVTPTGEVVWEFYAPWGTYDAERVTYGDEPGGPTTRELNASGQYTMTGSAQLTPGTGDQVTFAQWLSNTFAGTPIAEQVTWLAQRWAHITPWIRPVWMGPWDFVAAALAGLVLVGWAGTELLYHRHRIRENITRMITQ